MQRRGGLVIGVLVGVLALAAAGCGGGDDNSGGSASATTAAPATTAASATTAAGGGGDNELTLTAQGTAWNTTSFDLKSGSSYTLEVTNKDSIEHNFTFAAGKANQDVEGGEDAKVTFTAPAAGSYPFFCKYHPTAMKGTITVT
jgi:plastocyanin